MLLFLFSVVSLTRGQAKKNRLVAVLFFELYVLFNNGKVKRF